MKRCEKPSNCEAWVSMESYLRLKQKEWEQAIADHKAVVGQGEHLAFLEGIYSAFCWVLQTLEHREAPDDLAHLSPAQGMALKKSLATDRRHGGWLPKTAINCEKLRDVDPTTETGPAA